MKEAYKRLKSRLRIILRHGDELNRRVSIENELGLMAAGKKPLPTKDECKIMALKLGTPVEYWPEEWREK